MSWLSITTTMVITLWVISLLRVLLASSPCIPSSPAFLSAGENLHLYPYIHSSQFCSLYSQLEFFRSHAGSSATKKRRNALLVVAHPDDESMYVFNFNFISAVDWFWMFFKLRNMNTSFFWKISQLVWLLISTYKIVCNWFLFFVIILL